MKRLITNTITGLMVLVAVATAQSCIYGDNIDYIYGTQWQSDEAPFGQTEITGLTLTFRCESEITLSSQSGQKRIISAYECNAENAYFANTTFPAGPTSISLTTARRKGTDLSLTWHITGDPTPHITHLRLIKENN